ncbi:hypothetical protein [Glycomyces rhizosphaerae]|uniref:DUF5666 domain-containing protein n=1 Tax=Glycomyces rhizosphaerae TaxID=2054422 RepID=A0ABV7Q8L6_9ACTN
MVTKEELVLADLPPMADDLHEALAVQRRPRTNKATKWLLAAVLISGGFVGGIAAQQQWGVVETGFEPGGGFGALPDGAQLPDEAGAVAAEETSGTVVMVDDTTVYIETEDGATVIVETTEDTEVRTASAADLSDLAEGDQVTVTGQAEEEGTVAAEGVTEIVD